MRGEKGVGLQQVAAGASSCLSLVVWPESSHCSGKTTPSPHTHRTSPSAAPSPPSWQDLAVVYVLQNEIEKGYEAVYGERRDLGRLQS